MPIIKSAIKKVRKDKKRTAKNIKAVNAYRATLKKIRKGGTGIAALVSKFYSQVDRAVKTKVIHKNKASRLKAGVAKLNRKK